MTTPKGDTDYSGQPHGWIQWKGTDVCIDLQCSCGHLGHCDTDFLYGWQCHKCKKKWVVGAHVKLIDPEVTGEDSPCDYKMDVPGLFDDE